MDTVTRAASVFSCLLALPQKGDAALFSRTHSFR
ncbi:hypothetical protein XF_2468 [Xylella fastidiosa 9a5c]|uniref:Uncharacterized protein n=1 Tax=Xylella fastidiosa (strain 9a5c) TaxID=160492 RepID=Q9PAM8_XYLFA|nr:hypothetical protein XF_2468 [Xylella fastidiosa 9a5c]